jgi:hypothetical protein
VRANKDNNKKMKKRDKNKREDARNFLHFALGIFLFTIIISFFFDVRFISIVIVPVFLIWGFLRYKEKIGQELIIAFLFSLFVTSYYLYEYSSFNIFIGKINLFPLIGWTFGLVILREIYEFINVKHKLLASSLIYITGLFLLEYVGFHILNVKLVSDFPSLFGLGIIHAPIGMKFFYILAGPIYLLVTDYLNVK